jgi:HK97 gp10 family phage protein
VAEEFRVRLYEHEILQLGDSAAAAELTLQAAEGVALDARRGAPRNTGRGAESIQPWPGRDARGPYADVSWDQDHFYMSFHENGTHKQPARPFLGPALDRYMHL